MTDFRPDCTINLHCELRGKPAKIAWSCSIVHPKRGRIVVARRFLGLVSREEAQLRALLFGLREAARLLQEKVEATATFPVEEWLGEEGPRRLAPELKPLREEAARCWAGFRYRRAGRMSGEEALALRGEAENAFRRRGKHDG
jgi:hypothetical protein